jgi:hypothetical protein
VVALASEALLLVPYEAAEVERSERRFAYVEEALGREWRLTVWVVPAR